LAQPPLYCIKVGNEKYYAQDDAQKEEIVESLPANRKYEIGRFKGLGEMTASELKETTLDPKHRILLKVDIDSQIEADTTFNQLFWKRPQSPLRSDYAGSHRSRRHRLLILRKLAFLNFSQRLIQIRSDGRCLFD